jgi:hypothetical protein
MANRRKPLPWRVQVAQAADKALASRPNWEKWPLPRQLNFLFSAEGTAEIVRLAQPHSLLAELHRHCLSSRPADERGPIQHLLRQLVQGRTALFSRPELAPALAQLGLHYHRRRRELADWKPRSKNAFQQLASLVRHLFDGYGDVPAWVREGWGQAPDQRNGLCLSALLVHLGSGQALRGFAGLPMPLGKRQEHFMRQAPASCTFHEAYRYAQLAERDATEYLGVVLDSRLGRHPIGPDDALYLAVLDLFRAEPEVDAWQFGAVCDYVHLRRHVGTPTEPAQPGFAVRGRTLASLLARTARWQRSLGRERANPRFSQLMATTWLGLPVPGFVGGTGDWVRIRQLLSYPELLEEGQQMQHCVASFMGRCLRSQAGIYSLSLGGARKLTLQLSPERRLVQVRGKHNRPPTAEERGWVLSWLTQEGISAIDRVWDTYYALA